MLLPSIHPFLWLLLLLPDSTASTKSSTPAGTGQSQPTAPSPEAKNHSSEPSVKSTPLTNLSFTSVGQTTTAKPSPTTTTLTATTERDDKSSGNRSTAAPSPTPQGQDPMRNESTTTSATQGTSEAITPTPNSSSQLPEPTPTDEKSPLTVAAFGVISFVIILIVVVIILVSVVSLRFKCNHSKDSEDKQKPGASMVSESCSADMSQKGNSITLISMKNINTNNSLCYPPSEKKNDKNQLSPNNKVQTASSDPGEKFECPSQVYLGWLNSRSQVYLMYYRCYKTKSPELEADT